MGERVARGERGECHGRADRLIELAGIAQRANQAVVGFVVRRVVFVSACDSSTKCLRGFGGRAGGKQVKPALGGLLGERFG